MERLKRLLSELPDHWSIMRVSRLGGETWRVYDNSQTLVADGDDLEGALEEALGNEREESYPVGMIRIYRGKEIPLGWQVCDGTNGVPDFTEQPFPRDFAYLPGDPREYHYIIKTSNSESTQKLCSSS